MPGGGRARGGPEGRVVTVPVLAAVYIGTVVGAGFASGQEVLQFFGLHGLKGVWAVPATTLVLALFGYLFMRAGHDLGAPSYGPVFDHVAGPVLGRVLDFGVSFFLFSGTGAMFAGAGATLAQAFGLPYGAGLGGMAMATALTVALGLRSVVRAVSAVVPFLLVAVLAVSMATVFAGPLNLLFAEPQRAPVGNWVLSGITCGSYNLLLAASVLAPLAPVTERQRLGPGVVLGALGLGFGVLAVDLSILAYVPEAARVEVPMVLAASRISPAAAAAYTVVLLAEVYTTAVSGLFGFVNRLTDGGGPRYVPLTLGATVVAAAAGLAGFSTLVSRLFPVMGYLGFILLGTLTLAYVRRRI